MFRLTLRFTFALTVIWYGLATGDTSWCNENAKSILVVGWESSGLNDAERRYESVTSGAAADAAVDYAMGLVRLKSRKYEDALTALHAATTRHPGHLAAWRAKCWLLVYLRKFDHAVAQMQALADIYPQDEKAPAVEADLVETARWLGRHHGHLTWAASTKLPMETHTAALTSKLSGERLKAFEAGREEVRAACEKLKADLAVIAQEDAEQEAERRVMVEEKNKSERVRIASEREELQTQAESAKSQADTAVQAVNTKLDPLEKQYRELEQKARPILNRVNDLQRRAKDRDADARKEKDQKRKRDIERDADRLREDARREERELAPLQRDAGRVQREAAGLQAERAKLIATFQASLAGINKNLLQLVKDEKAVENSEKALTQPPDPTPRYTSLAAKIEAISTYQKFPLEEERARLLE
jgi:hypothetical protein